MAVFAVGDVAVVGIAVVGIVVAVEFEVVAWGGLDAQGSKNSIKRDSGIDEHQKLRTCSLRYSG